MITVYTVNHCYGDPIEKRKALKFTKETVVLDDGKREVLNTDSRASFATLEKAVEYFEFYHKMRLKFIERQLERQHKDKAFFDVFVAKEKEESAW